MERMTFKNGDDYWCVTNDNCFEEQSEHYCGPAIERLAAYEDTGLTPEEIVDRLAKAKLANILEAANKKALDKLMEYQKAETVGRLVVLPCRVGDTVWIPLIEKQKAVNLRVQGISVTVSGRTILRFGGYPFESAWGDACGKAWFLTREEAEAKLREGESK